jgi:hypothetical protein
MWRIGILTLAVVLAPLITVAAMAADCPKPTDLPSVPGYGGDEVALRGSDCRERRFAADSLLEGERFEPSVPRKNDRAFSRLANIGP